MALDDKEPIIDSVHSKTQDRQPPERLKIETREFGDELKSSEVRLFKLVRHGTPKEVEEFLKEKNDGLDINKKDAEFHTVLQIAVFRRSPDIVKLLLDHKCKDSRAVELAGALRYNDILQVLIASSPPDNRSANIQGKGTVSSSDDRSDDCEEGGGAVTRNAGRRRFGLKTVTRCLSKFQQKLAPQNGAVNDSVQLAGCVSRDEAAKSDQDIRRMLIAAIDANDYTETKKLVNLLNEQPDSKALFPHCLCPKCRMETKDLSESILQEANDRLEVCHILSSPTYILVTAVDPISTALYWANHLQSMAYWHGENREEFLHLAKRSSKLAVDLLATCNNENDVEILFQMSHKKDVPVRRLFGMDNELEYRCLHHAVGRLQKEFVTHPSCQHVVSKLWFGSCYNSWRKWSTPQRMFYVLWQALLMPFIFILNMLKVKFAKSCLDVPLNRFIYAATSYIFFLVTVVANQYVIRATNWPTPSVEGYDFIIGLWVIGHVCKIVTDYVTLRHSSYSRLWWTTYDIAIIVFFMAVAVTFFVGSGSKNGELQIANWRVALLYQGFYAIAMTLACLRILQWLHLSSTLGPLVISFSEMTVVIRRLFVIFSIVIFSFSLGIYTIYKNFQTDSPEDNKNETFFTSYVKTLKILFWAILGKGEGNYASVPDQYHYNVRNVNMTAEFQESFTVLVGYALWYLFHIAVVVVLLNMLIAVMTHYYQIIQDNGDTEWKFARTKLWMYYVEKNSRYPPPLNIFAITFRFAEYLLNRWRSLASDQPDGQKPEDNTTKHKKVVENMIEKYLHKRELIKSREQR